MTILEKFKTLKLKDALQRIGWRFTQGKPFTPNQNDVDSFNKIVEFVNLSIKETVNENELFSKLYIYCLMNEVMFYKDIDYANRHLNALIKKPFEYHYEMFKSRLNDTYMQNFSNSIGLNTKHAALQSDDEREADKVLLNQHEADYLKHVKGLWSDDEIKDNLDTNICLIINEIRCLSQ